MPEDVAQYSSLGDDINRALQAAIASQGSDGGSSTSGSPDPDDPQSGVGASTQENTFYGGPTSERSGALVAGRDVGGPVPSAIDAIGPGSADSVPVPLLIVLGGLSILLLSSGPRALPPGESRRGARASAAEPRARRIRPGQALR